MLIGIDNLGLSNQGRIRFGPKYIWWYPKNVDPQNIVIPISGSPLISGPPIFYVGTCTFRACFQK